MRSIPFKVIALLGLNEGEFPKIDKVPTFDLLGQNFRKGDRSRRSDDRYQFLEILLSARQQLIVTYQGLSIQNNDAIPPSVVISELLDVLENYYQLTGLITKHPLQAFSHRYFDESSDFSSFSKTHYETAVALDKTKHQPEQWWQGSLDTKIPDIIELNDLFSFYRHPQNYFLQRKLGLNFGAVAEDIDERELFELNGLDLYEINQQWIEHRLNDKIFSLKKLQAQGRWLSGTYGKQVFEQHQQAIDEFSELIKQQKIGQKSENQFIDIHVDEYRLIGNLSNIYENGSLIYRYANLKGKDFMLAWLHHLIINKIQPQNTHLISLDDNLIFNANNQQADALKELIEYYIQGQQQPDVFFTESAFAYTKQALKLKTSNRAKKTALFVAQELLVKEMENNRALHQLYQNVEDLTVLLNENFETHCKNLILPAWEAVQIE
jgi:exodeoxyribonuclease V gamma subunit